MDAKPCRKGREGIKSYYTPTGNGLVWLSAPIDRPEKRPCNKDINPVYQ